MVMIVGLGNPGSRYAGTRHNVGFEVVDELAARHGIALAGRGRRAWTGRGTIGGKPVLLAKPTTYMNLSGEAVGELSRYYQIPAERIWVVVDDVALPVGVVRLRLKGSSGGHHGLESIEAYLGTRAYPRIRIGIGGAGRDDLVGHVLARFRPDERVMMDRVIRTAADAVEVALQDGFEIAMSRFNGTVLPTAQEAPDES